MPVPRLPARGHASQGFTLIELLIVLAITAAGILWVGAEKVNDNRRAVVLAAAGQINVIGEATKAYLAHNLPTLDAALPAGPRTTAVTVAQLQAAGACGAVPCLPGTVAATNVWGAGYSTLIRRTGVSAPYAYEFLLVTVANGSVLGSYEASGVTRVDLVSYAASRTSAAAGFTFVPNGGVAPQARGGSWSGVPKANYPAIVSGPNLRGGQLAYYFTTLTLPPPLYDQTYLRTDGGNKMTANLNANGHGMYGLTEGVNAPGVIAAGSASASNALRMDDLAVTGAANVATLTATGAVIAASVTVPGGNNIRVGNSILYGDTGNTALRQSGGVYFQNQAGTAGADIAQVGNINAQGTVAAAKVQVTDVVVEGTGCPSNGLIGRDATGLLLSCQSWVWKKQGGGMVATRSNAVTAWRWPTSFVSCNSNERVQGGGGSCSGGAGFNFLRASTPNGNGWYVSCDTPYDQNVTAIAYATCESN